MSTLPPLITSEGIVLNNMMPQEGALGSYTPPGTASSEGISLMMRGVLQAAIATGDAEKITFAKMLFDAACTYFFRGIRPTSTKGQKWYHSWLVNGGASFNTRGPIPSNGDLAQTGYLYGRDSQSTVTFTNGVGQLNPAPDIVYQVVSSDAALVWDNVFSDLTSGTSYKVNYYIDANGAKIYGTQKAGSFGQPSEANSGETPGKIVLSNTLFNGTAGVNYCVTNTSQSVAYGELYEGWPMWRKLYPTETTAAGDAIHWFIEAFVLGKKINSDDGDWANALDRMLEVWQETCAQESNTLSIFKSGSDGVYNNFPLTYSYAYGKSNIDDANSTWSAIAPTDKYTAERTTDNYITFTAPLENAVVGSGKSIRYGLAFENKPLYLNYTTGSSISADIHSTIEQTLSMEIEGLDGITYTANFPVGPTTTTQTIGMNQFLQFQQEDGDATGDKTGDWSGDDGTPWVMPTYSAVAFPGRRLFLVGDSITWYNNYYYPPNSNQRYEYYSMGMNGYYNFCDQILGGRLECEPGIQPDPGGQHNGYNVSVAGSKVSEWWKETISPLGIDAAGPMYAALNNLGKFDVAVMMGGTNDLAGNAKAADVLLNLKKASTDIAKNGKWVFLVTITPRSRKMLDGYTVAEQDTIRGRLKDINQGLRDWMATDNPPNIWLVDCEADLLGPNGIDPAGWDSSSGTDVLGNYRTDAPNTVFNHDGLHPTTAGAYVIGKKLASVMVLAGVPARVSATSLGPLTLGDNLLSNPTFTFTQYPMTAPVDSQGVGTAWNYTRPGWAVGLGDHLTVGSDPALHNGYTHGKMPDGWHFYRCTNAQDLTIGYTVGKAGVYSNFLNYAFSDFMSSYPTLSEYTGDSTWPDGAVVASIIVDTDGSPAMKFEVDIPQTGNKNEGFVIQAFIPKDQHGAWDNYGYITPDFGSVHPNTVYSTGDIIQSECTVSISRQNETLHSHRMVLNFLDVNPNDINTSGAKMSSIGHSHNFWPPSDMDRNRSHPEDVTLKYRSPAVKVPAPSTGETSIYCQFRLEFSFDASKSGATATIIVKNPSVRKVISGVSNL